VRLAYLFPQPCQPFLEVPLAPVAVPKDDLVTIGHQTPRDLWDLRVLGIPNSGQDCEVIGEEPSH